MKIVHVIIGSGLFNEKLAYQDNILPKYHRKLGHEVTIIAPSYYFRDQDTGKRLSKPLGFSWLDDGTKILRLKPYLPQKLTDHLHLYKGLADAIKNESPDLIFAHSVASLNYLYFPRYMKKNPNVKIVFDNHADWVNSCHTWMTRCYNRYILRLFLVSRLRKISDSFYGVTPARCDFLRDMYGVEGEKVKLLPMGADDDEMQVPNRIQIREEVRKQYGIMDDDFLIVSGGNIDPLKNIHVLAEAVNKSEFEKIKILIFGPIRSDLKIVFDRLSSDRIKTIGRIPSNEVYRYFYAADIVMFPGLHSVLWEQAVASQVPCAFSLIKGFEHVDIGGNCVFMDGKTADYYQQLIENLYNDMDNYRKLCVNAHSKKSQQFLYSQIAKKVIDDCFGATD